MERDEQLLAVLCTHLDRPALRFSETLHLLEGGYSNEISRFRLEDAPPPFNQPLVLRLTHDERDTAREGIIENGVAEQGFRAPPVLLWGGSLSAFGRPFLVTPLSPGLPFDETITVRTAISAFRRLPDQLATAMLALHQVPTENITARLAADGWEPDRLDSLAVLADIDDYAEQANSSDLRRRAAVLRKNQPSLARPVVCHGDLHPFNLLFAGNQVTVVLDWELARLADPAYDVGRTLVLLRLAPYPMSRITRTVVQPFATALSAPVRAALPRPQPARRIHYPVARGTARPAHTRHRRSRRDPRQRLAAAAHCRRVAPGCIEARTPLRGDHEALVNKCPFPVGSTPSPKRDRQGALRVSTRSHSSIA